MNKKTKDFKKVCVSAFKEKVPVIVSVQVDYSENIKLMEKLGHLVCPI